MKKDSKKRKELLETLRTLKPEELKHRIQDETDHIFWTRYKKKTNKSENKESLKLARKNLARALTVQKELGLKVEPKKAKTQEGALR